MLSRKLLVLLVCAISILLFPVAKGQSTNASLSGQVTDIQGLVIVGVDVEAVDQATNVTYKVKTNSDGVYWIPDLPPGTYEVRISKTGFRTMLRPGITLNVEDTRALNATLQVGDSAEIVRVEGGISMLNTASATVSTTIDRNFAENMPLNGRSFQTLIMLTPGVVFTNANVSNDAGQFSVNGQRADANYFMVDGVGANFGVVDTSAPGQVVSGVLPAFTSLGGTNSLVPVDALQEFTLQTSSYGAEYGRSPGGQVSIETRSGTNDFHGTAFDYFRNTVLDANTWFNDQKDLAKAPERQNDFGGVFGGPIVKDRTFFFASYEGLRLLQPTTDDFDVPSLCLRGAGNCQGGETAAAAGLKPILQSFPLPSGPEYIDNTGAPLGAAPFTETISNPSTIDSGTIRLDQAVNRKLLLFGRYSDSESTLGQFLSATYFVTHAHIRTITIGANWNATSQFTNSVRFNYSSDSVPDTESLANIGGAKPFDTSILFPSYVSPTSGEVIAGFSVGNSFFDTQVGSAGINTQRQWNVIDSATYLVKNHALKFGVDYRRLTPDFKQPTFIAFAQFFSEASVVSGIADNFFVNAQTEVRPRFTNLSLYLDDTWKLSPRLTLNYGLRYELNPVPSEAHGIEPLNVIGLNNPATAALAAMGTPPYHTRYGDFGPRLGVAYQVSQSPQFALVLRSGIGMFYDTGADSAASGYNSVPFVYRSNYGQTNFPSASLPGPPTSTLIPPFDSIYGIDPHLSMPYTLQWNVTLEQALGINQSLSVGYVAASGRNLLRQDDLYNFNPNFVTVFAIRNAASSNYNSLQVQYKRRLTHGLQALASYTYAHSIDDASNGVSPSDSTSTFTNPNLDRGSSNFDVRHTFTSAATYDIPKPELGAVGEAILGHWSVDTIGIARTALPVNLVGGFSDDGQATVRPDVVPGAPLYLSGAQCKAANGGVPCPGGRALNFTRGAVVCPSGSLSSGPFCRVPLDANGGAARQGTLGRNAVRGLGAWQMDFALHRQFDFTERCKLQFRAEAFNVFNHPNFGLPNTSVGSGRFGRASNMLSQSYGSAGLSSLYQIGGPRSVQLALKLAF